MPFERTTTTSPSTIPRRRGVRGRELDLAPRALEVELRHALDGGSGEERPVALQAQRAALRRRGSERASSRARAPRRRAAPAAARAARCRRGRGRGRGASRARRRRPPRAAGSSTSKRARELRDPRELVGAGRWHGAAQALHAALEVHRGPVALERSRRGEDQIGPAARELVEHREDDDALGLLGERAHVGVAGGLVARDERAARSAPGSLSSASAATAQASGDPARVGRGREMERAAARLLLEPELVRELRDACAARLRRAPTRRAPPARPARSFFPSALRDERARGRSRRPHPAPSASCRSGSRRRPRRRGACASLIQRSTIGARSTTGSSPTTTTISASPIALSGRRNASSASEVASGRTAECASRPIAQEAPERIRDLGRLGAGERGDDRAAASREHRLEPRRARRPRRSPSRPFLPRRSGVVIRSAARRCGYEKRPLSQSQPRSISGWLRERIRVTFPSRIVADVLQPTRAARADGRHVLDVPRPRVEAVQRRRERADRAELDDVARERRAVRLVLEGRDLRVRAAVPRDELAVLGDVLGEARAAVAEDAALAVERDER